MNLMIQPEKTTEKTADAHAAPWVVAYGQRLERARGRKGLTQAALAGSELSKSFISLLETARSYPSVETLVLLAQRLGTSLGDLLFDPDVLRLDVALSLMALARGAAWSRPDWSGKLVDTVEELLPDLPLWIRAETATIRATAAAAQNRLDVAERLARQAEAHAERAGFVPGKASALALRGELRILRREYGEAAAVLNQAVALYRESGSLRGEPGVTALIWLATATARGGRSRGARRIYQKARVLARRLHLDRQEGLALWGLGYLAWNAGDLAQASQLLQGARDALDKSEDLFNLAGVAENLAAVERDQGKLDHALAAARQAVHVMDRLQNLRGRSGANLELAQILRLQGNLVEAQQAVNQALRDARAVDDPMRRALALAELGRLAAQRGDRATALRHLRTSLRSLQALGLSYAAEVERDLGFVRQGGTPQAEVAHYLAEALGQPDLARAPRRPARPRQRSSPPRRG